MNKLILGTVQMGLDYGINNSDGKVSLTDSIEIMNHAFDNGIQFLDTAEAYGNAHEVIGKFHLNNSEKQFSIITKVPRLIDGNINDKIDNYLKTLQVDHIHTLMFHAFATFKNNPSVLQNMLELKEQGILKNIGISIYTNEEFEEVLKNNHFDVIQIPFNLLDNWALRGDLILEAKRRGKIIHTRSAFLQGLFFKNLLDENKTVKSLKEELIQLNSIAGEQKISLVSLALNYCLQNERVDNVLIGVDTLQQLKDNLSIAGQKLSSDTLSNINNIKIQDLNLLNSLIMELNTILITQARKGSTRLPGKVLRKIQGKELLLIHLDRLKSCKNVDKIVVATTTEPSDLEIADLVSNAGYEFYRGSENDVLDRFYQSIKQNGYTCNWVVRVTSDCPLIDPKLLDAVIAFAQTNDLDYCSNVIIEHFPDGQDVEVFKFSALEKAWKESTLQSDREHVTPYIRNNSTAKGKDLFVSMNFACKDNFNAVRMTVDEEKDYLLVKEIIEQIGTEKSWLEYTRFISDNDLLKINNDIVRNEGYFKSLKND